MGQLIKINRKLNPSSPCLLVQLKGLVSTPVLTCRMDGWICVVGVPGLDFSLGGPLCGISLRMFLCMFSTFREILLRWGDNGAGVGVCVPSSFVFSTLLWEWWSLESTERCQRYVGVHFWESTKSAASCMCWSASSSVHRQTSCVCRGQSPLVLPSLSYILPFLSVPHWCCRSCSWGPSWRLL